MLFEGTFGGARTDGYKPKDKPEVIYHLLGLYDGTVGNVELVYDPDTIKLPAPGTRVQVDCRKFSTWNFGKEIRFWAGSLRLADVAPASAPRPKVG
jgi:hypothetical protein